MLRKSLYKRMIKMCDITRHRPYTSHLICNFIIEPVQKLVNHRQDILGCIG